MLDKAGQLGRYSKAGRDVRKKRRARTRVKVKLADDGALVLREDSLQRQCEDYLEACGIDYYLHIPDAVLRLCGSYGTNSSLRTQISEAFKGLVDLIIFGPGPSLLCVELKSATGRVTPEQEAFLRNLYGDQWERYVCRTFEAFEVLVKTWRGL
jgi:hypothetical protein